MFPYYARKLLEKNYQFQLLFLSFFGGSLVILASDWYPGTERYNSHIFMMRHEYLNFITAKNKNKRGDWWYGFNPIQKGRIDLNNDESKVKKGKISTSFDK